jgi:hypothetical protein
MPVQAQSMMMMLAILAAYPAAPCKAQDAAAASIADVGALLAGRYDNSAQVAQGKAAEDDRPPQHVVITLEPAQRADWEILRVHMDVDPAVAQAAGSDESLDAVWALNISRPAPGKRLQLIPYTLRPSLDEASVKASAFDQGQWLPLEACALNGDLGASRITAQAPADEMCVAETMGLGGKRAFLPSRIERQGDSLSIQLIYFGKPWLVDARRIKIPSHDDHPAP